MFRRFVNVAILTVAFPALMSLIVYKGFGPNCTRDVYHEAGFRDQYESGVYKYRVLGRVLLLTTNDLLKDNTPGLRIALKFFGQVPASVKVLDTNADLAFYVAYFVQNTFFLILASIVLYWILTRQPTEPALSVTWAQMIGVLLMVVTQYVICPYDTLSYFLTLFTFGLIMRPFPKSYAVLIVVLILSTLTRESSALTLSFYFAWHYRKFVQLSSREVRQLAGLVVTFVATYVVIRIMLPQQGSTFYHTLRMSALGRAPTLIGIAALPIVGYMLASGTRNLKVCTAFIAACSPYILCMILVADTWETRLWAPIWLGLLILARESPEEREIVWSPSH